MLTKKEKKKLIELLCDEQVRIIVKDHTMYESKTYQQLEALKIKIKDM